MTINEILLAILGLAGWLWAIVQFFLNRRHQRRDRLIEKRHEVYATFMNLIDEAQAGMQHDLRGLTSAYPAVMATIISGDIDAMDKAISEFNSNLMNWMQRATLPLLKINQETNRMTLVCSREMMALLNRYRVLANDYCNEFQIITNRMSNNRDISVTAKELALLGQDKRADELARLWPLMIAQMRSELDIGR